VGGAYGRGIVYEGGAQVGWADLSEASVGAQVGGQQYALIVAFENKTDVDRFKSGKFTLGGNASAVALKSGVAKSTRFQDGTAVFVYPLAGGMVEATVAGKSLTYVPMTGDRANNPDRPGDRTTTTEERTTTTIERDRTTTTRPVDRR
jgi:lipid-binding SYLF domain-containing protein